MAEISNQTILEMVSNVKDDTSEIKNHLKELNGKVAAHEKWINTNNNVVTKEAPSLIKKVERIDKKIYAAGAVLATIQIILGYFIALYKK